MALWALGSSESQSDDDLGRLPRRGGGEGPHASSLLEFESTEPRVDLQ